MVTNRRKVLVPHTMGKQGVDGVYSADPHRHPDAVKFDELTYNEVLIRGLKVMDATAFALCRDQNMLLKVFSIFVPGALKRVVLGEDEGLDEGLRDAFRAYVVGDAMIWGATARMLGDLTQCGVDAAFAVGSRTRDCLQDDRQMLRRRRYVIDNAVDERDETYAIALPAGEISEARGEVLCVFELRNTAIAEAHRCRSIQDDREVGVGVGLERLDAQPVGARVPPPVDVPRLVARQVLPVLGEVRRRAEVRRPVQPPHEAVHHRARQ